jgi:hypothetical protein
MIKNVRLGSHCRTVAPSCLTFNQDYEDTGIMVLHLPRRLPRSLSLIPMKGSLILKLILILTSTQMMGLRKSLRRITTTTSWI